MDDLCPKCGTFKNDAESCPRCGLVFSRFDAAAVSIDVPEEIVELFRHADADWGDRARHALFTEKALAAGFAGYAAAKYRNRGPDDAVAVEQLSRIAARLEQELAMSSVANGRHGDVRHGKPALYLLAIILFLVVGAFGVALALR
jgi:hypothetical protein